MRLFSAPLVLAAVLLTLPHPVRADGGRCPTPEGPKQLCAFRAPSAPDVDGVLTDGAWQQASFTDSFTQREPVEGAAPTDRTEVAIIYTDEALYVAARVYDQHLSDRRPQVTRRDRGSTAERIIVSLDTYFDRRTAYSFGVTSAGTRLDFYHPSDNEWHRDATFDPVWTAETKLTSWGWTAEMRIPFSQLRFDDADEQRWGLNVTRVTPARNERVYWTLIPEAEAGWASHFNPLVGLRGLHPARRLEVRPYVAGSATATSEDVSADPLRDATAFDARVGGDVAFDVGSTLTLSGTVNPDFGQVEADPAVVNLSAFETFFGEKRPFFTEDRQLLQSGAVSGEIDYFYSRRIGAHPPGDAEGDFVEQPQNTTILGAAKLTGRLPSGLSIGALAAVTGREYAQVFDSVFVRPDAAGRPADTLRAHTWREEVAPPSAYGVLRLQQEFGPDASKAGVMLTGVRRQMDAASPVALLVPSQAVTASADVELRFLEGRYELGADAGFSHASGTAAAITELQQSSRRYYQRPDAEYIGVDTTRTALRGYRAGVRVQKRSGAHWRWSTGANATSPAFELNDLGRQRRADALNPWLYAQYLQNAPGSFYQEYRLSLVSDHKFNYGGTYTGSYTELDSDLTWTNFWRSSLEVAFMPRRQSDVLTRGGPLMQTAQGWRVGFDHRNGGGQTVGWRLEGGYEANDLGGYGYRGEVDLAYRPAGRWRVSFGPEYRYSVNTRQYVTQIERPTFDRYVFSAIERSTLSAQLRINVAFTPDLTLELYAEPYAASGRFDRFGELAAPRTSRLRPYGEDDLPLTPLDAGTYEVTDAGDVFTFEQSDFNLLSFRSNAVLRWQWRPGSTFFLVWQQNRDDERSAGSLITPLDFTNALTSPGTHFVAVKLTYWMPVS